MSIIKEYGAFKEKNLFLYEQILCFKNSSQCKGIFVLSRVLSQQAYSVEKQTNKKKKKKKKKKKTTLIQRQDVKSKLT